MKIMVVKDIEREDIEFICKVSNVGMSSSPVSTKADRCKPSFIHLFSTVTLKEPNKVSIRFSSTEVSVLQINITFQRSRVTFALSTDSRPIFKRINSKIS